MSENIRVSSELAEELDKIMEELMYKPLRKCWFENGHKVWQAVIKLKAAKDANPVKPKPEEMRELAHRDPWNAMEAAMDGLMNAYNDQEGKMMKFYEAWREQEFNKARAKEANVVNLPQEIDDENQMRMKDEPLDGITHKVLSEPFEKAWMEFRAAMESPDEEELNERAAMVELQLRQAAQAANQDGAAAAAASVHLQDIDDENYVRVVGGPMNGMLRKVFWEPLNNSWAEFIAAMEEEEENDMIEHQQADQAANEEPDVADIQLQDGEQIPGEHLDQVVHNILWEPLERNFENFQAAMEGGDEADD